MRRTLLATVALTAALLSPLPAAAVQGGGGDGPPPDNGGTPTGGEQDGGADLPTTDTGESSDSGGTATDQVRNCSIVSSPAYLGVACGSSGGRDRRTVKEILGDDPVPECWDDPLTAAELSAMGLQNEPGEDGQTWYWERCLVGIDPETYKIGPDGISFEIGVISIENGDPVRTLTHNQQQLVEFNGVDQQIPAPIAAVSPSANPRVGGWVSFFNGSRNEVTASAGGSVLLRARVTSLTVEPLGEGKGSAVSCPGNGVRAAREDTPQTRPEGCWHRYEQSSAAQPDQKYPVLMTAHWTVDVSETGAAGPFRVFNTFEKSQVTNVPVTEIQALVIR